MQMLVNHSDFAATLVAWQHEYGRHDLPWQKDDQIYTTWLSEIMLQQTQVNTVIPYYKRFTAVFPSLSELAAADREKVLALWSGLGYYARAINLHRAAQIIVQEHAGNFPTTFETVRRLPGIGDSTAGAILSLSLNLPYAMVDGNARRVLSRYFGLAYSDYGSFNAFNHQLWAIARSVLSIEEAKSYNQGLMDLGALVCTRTDPDCEQCPIRANCLARQRSAWVSYPGKKRAIHKKSLSWHWIVCTWEDKIWLVTNRRKKGIWRELTTFLTLETPEAWQHWRESGLCPHNTWFTYQILDRIQHICTHLILDIAPHWLRFVHTPNTQLLNQLAGEGAWYPFVEARTMSLPKPVRVIVEYLETEQMQESLSHSESK